MRIELLGSLLVLLAVGPLACGGSAPPPTTPATRGSPAPAGTEASNPTDDEAWAGESAAKNSGGQAPEAKTAVPSADEAPAAADAKVAESRTMEVIRKAVMDNRKAARKCYDDARKQLNDLQGDVTIHFVIDPEGKVKSAELNQERSSLKSPAVVDCVLTVIRSIQFPRSSRGMETSTNYPFNFTP